MSDVPTVKHTPLSELDSTQKFWGKKKDARTEKEILVSIDSKLSQLIEILEKKSENI
jgi:hypothetical protein